MPVILASAVRQVRYSERAGNCQPHISALAGVICFRCCTGKIHDISKSQILAFSFYFQMIQNWQDTPGVCVSVFTLWAEPSLLMPCTLLAMIIPVRRISNPSMVNLISRAGVLVSFPVSFLERENNTNLSRVFSRWVTT